MKKKLTQEKLEKVQTEYLKAAHGRMRLCANGQPDFRLTFEFNPESFPVEERRKLHDIMTLAVTYIKDSKSGQSDVRHPFEYFYRRVQSRP